MYSTYCPYILNLGRNCLITNISAVEGPNVIMSSEKTNLKEMLISN